MTRSNEPGPGERRLGRPPSERYREAEPESPADRPASVRRGVGLAAVAAIGETVAIVVAGGVLLITAGLVAVAAIGGWAVAMGLRVGSAGLLDRRRRVGTAVALAVAGVVLGQLGLWAYGRFEGGVLGPVDYLNEVYGPLVALEIAAAAVAAWLTAR